MYTAKVVVREMQGDSGFQVRQFLAERIGQPRKAPNLHSYRQVQGLVASLPAPLDSGSMPE